MRAEPQAPGSVRLQAELWPEALDRQDDLPGATFFHTARWFRALQSAVPRYSPYVLAVYGEDGAVQAACPFAAVRRLGTLCLYAGPLGTYGGILARTAAAATTLRQYVVALPQHVAAQRTAPRLALVRIHDFVGSLSAVQSHAPGWQALPESCQVLDLPADPSLLFRDAFTAQNRNKIRKAERAGLTVRRAADAAALAAYAALYRACLPRWKRRHGLPAALFAALAEADGVEVWLAERRGAIVAALLNLRAGGQIMNWGNVSLPAAWQEAPNNLLHWRALEAACHDAAGPRLYNFGSSAGLPGVHAFKAAFGAREHHYERLEYRAPWLAWAARLRGGRKR